MKKLIVALALIASGSAFAAQTGDSRFNRNGIAAVHFAEYLNGFRLNCNAPGESLKITAKVDPDGKGIELVMNEDAMFSQDMSIEETPTFFILSDEPDPPIFNYAVLPKGFDRNSTLTSDWAMRISIANGDNGLGDPDSTVFGMDCKAEAIKP